MHYSITNAILQMAGMYKDNLISHEDYATMWDILTYEDM